MPSDLLIVDSTEPAWVSSHLEKLDFAIVIGPLDFGDIFAPAYDLLIERKQAEDFRKSLMDGRMDRQREGLKAHAWPVVLIHDLMPWDEWHSAQWPMCFAETLSLQARSGIIVLSVACKEERRHTRRIALADAVRLIVRYVKEPSRSRMPKIRKPAPKQISPKVAFIAGLPGMGQRRATTVLAYFETVANAISNVNGWAELPGIGKGTVEQCQAFLDRR